jgi:hypothetical protein
MKWAAASGSGVCTSALKTIAFCARKAAVSALPIPEEPPLF